MSPSVPILFALLLPLVSGSTEGGWGTGGVALLRQTLRYWRKIYNTYDDEVTLGYCWADYLAQISVELWMNPSASLFPTRDLSNTTGRATKSQRNPFPANVMADVTRHEGTSGGHSREKRSRAPVRSAISDSVKDPNGRRIATRWKLTGARERRPTRSEAGRDDVAAASEPLEGADLEMITFYTRRRLPDARSKPPRGEREASRCEFSSRGASSRAVNPTPDPRDDEEVAQGSPGEKKADTRRKVLRPATIARPPSFSLGAARGRRRKSLLHPVARRFRFRRRDPSSSSSSSSSRRERNWRVSEPLSGSRETSAPEGRGGPLSENESPSTPRRWKFLPPGSRGRDPRGDAVKLMDSSRDPTRLINSKASRRKCGELFGDSPLEPRRDARQTERKKDPSPRSSRSDGRDRRRPDEEEGSRCGRDVLPGHGTIHPAGGSPAAERSRRQMPRENRESCRELIIPRERSRGRKERAANGEAEGLRRSGSPAPLETAVASIEQRSVKRSLIGSVRALVIGILRTLGMLVQIGQQIVDAVDSNPALTCTRDYLLRRFDDWLDA